MLTLRQCTPKMVSTDALQKPSIPSKFTRFENSCFNQHNAPLEKHVKVRRETDSFEKELFLFGRFFCIFYPSATNYFSCGIRLLKFLFQPGSVCILFCLFVVFLSDNELHFFDQIFEQLPVNAFWLK